MLALLTLHSLFGSFVGAAGQAAVRPRAARLGFGHRCRQEVRVFRSVLQLHATGVSCWTVRRRSCRRAPLSIVSAADLATSTTVAESSSRSDANTCGVV